MLMWLTAPLSLPTAWLLDFCLPRRRSSESDDDASLTTLLGGRQRLKAILSLHGDREGLGGELKEDEVKVRAKGWWHSRERFTSDEVTTP